MLLNNYEFKIGIMPGDYHSDRPITDSILKRVDIAYILIDNIVNKSSFSHDKALGSICFPAEVSVSDSSIVTVFFNSPIEF